MSDLPKHADDGRPVLQLYENAVYQCPGCGFEVAVEQGDSYTGLGLRCIECDSTMGKLDDEQTVEWREIDPDAYAQTEDSR